MTATIIDGAQIAREIRERTKARISEILSDPLQKRRPPCLAVILVGDDPASHIYVAGKEKACAGVGIQSRTFRLPAATTQDELLGIIRELNADAEVDGILLQLPIPEHMSRSEAIRSISPSKDVDGLHPVNQGLLQWNLPGLYPCTPLGVLELLRSSGEHLPGRVAAVLGRSLLVGAPTAALLAHAGASLISLHSLSINPKELVKQADIVVVATGVHHLVQADWIKPGATVIDVGMHRRDGKLSGDVNFAEVSKVAGKITPVPGGVGPMTIAMLVANCLQAYERQRLGLGQIV